jgi:uncharacterized protein YjbI with pentapeptide repeats
VAAVATEDYEEVRHVFLTSEPMRHDPQTVKACHGLFLSHLAEQETIFETESLLPEEIGPDILGSQEAEKELGNAREQMRSALSAMGLDPDQPIAEPDEASQQATTEMLARMGMTLDADPGPLSRERVQKGVLLKESFAGQDLTGLDLSGLGMRDTDFTGAILAGVNFSASDLSSSVFSSADLSNACLIAADLKSTVFKDSDLTGADLTHADLRNADLQDAVVEEAVLKNVRLDESALNGASFSRSDLTAACLNKASCREADFSHCRLHEADFTGADLSQACLENAVGLRVNMSDADLSGVRASGSTDLSMGRFVRITAADAIWENAVLNGADFSFATMEGANFAAASLLEADFLCADLKYARLSKSVLCQARCISMNLFQATLERADLTDTDFRGSNLYGVEFLDAITDATLFGNANISMTKLSGRTEK